MYLIASLSNLSKCEFATCKHCMTNFIIHVLKIQNDIHKDISYSIIMYIIMFFRDLRF